MKISTARLGIILVGLSLSTLALILFFVAIGAIIDPVGTQMANDNNPLGKPPAQFSNIVLCLVSVGLFFSGCYLVKWKR